MAVFTTATSVLQASATNTAGSTTTGSWIDMTGTAGGLVDLLVTNGGTGPTVACSAFVDSSPDNGTTIYQDIGGGTANTTASAVNPFHVVVPAGTRYIRSRFTGNTSQSVTVQADVHRFTGAT